MEDNTKAEVAKMDEFDYEYWAKHFNVSVEEFKRAREKVGDNLEEIAKYFKK
ncbi:DUF3606 domain-containing protein [Mucilaginibacter sp. CAU 1740]|uniref:DUF3606 domain-containing protein n=1 Tax=Mucilaginibacter sp. CAU 1740 TaxID=3140365 RepID=UPI00325B97D3